MRIRPITLKAANVYVEMNHRHNRPCAGHKWSIACYDGDRLCGVAICGQPIARKLDDGETIEIRRVCTDGTRNACSCLYGACARIAKEFGYKRIITYTLKSEGGQVYALLISQRLVQLVEQLGILQVGHAKK